MFLIIKKNIWSSNWMPQKLRFLARLLRRRRVAGPPCWEAGTIAPSQLLLKALELPLGLGGCNRIRWVQRRSSFYRKLDGIKILSVEIWWNNMKYVKRNDCNSILEATRLRLQPATVVDNIVRCVSSCMTNHELSHGCALKIRMASWVQSKFVTRSEIGDSMWRKYQEGPALINHKWTIGIPSQCLVRLDVNPIIGICRSTHLLCCRLLHWATPDFDAVEGPSQLRRKSFLYVSQDWGLKNTGWIHVAYVVNLWYIIIASQIQASKFRFTQLWQIRKKNQLWEAIPPSAVAPWDGHGWSGSWRLQKTGGIPTDWS